MPQPGNEPGRPRVSLARDGRRALIGTVFSQGTNLLVILVLARVLGGEAVGQYAIAFAMRALLLLLGALGARTAMTKFVATYRTHGDHGSVRGAVALGLLVPGGVSLVLAGAWFFGADWLATEVFSSPELGDAFRYFALSVPPGVVMLAALAATQGFLTMGPYTWVGQVLEPGTRLLLTVAVILGSGGVAEASLALLIASSVGAIASLGALRRLMGELEPTRRTYDVRGFAAFSLTSWVATLATQGMLWADIVILGALVTAAEVGQYQVATRIVLIATIAITPLTAAMAGRISASWAAGEPAAADRQYRTVILWSSRLTAPLLAGAVAVPAAVLSVFGGEFTAGVAVIYILVLGALSEPIGAPSGVMLNQIGRNGINMAINVTALTTNIGLNFLLIPALGIEGAAIAWAISMLASAVARVVAVRRLATGRWPFQRRGVMAFLAAGAASAAAAGAGSLAMEGSLVQLLVGAVIVLPLYGFVVLAFGISAEERDKLVRTVTNRAPVLRRLVSRWRLRGAERLEQRLRIDDVVSPFRYDVRARADLFELARREEDLRERDFEAFARLAFESSYGDWFREIVLAKTTHRVESPAQQFGMFRAIVTASLALMDRVESQGAQSAGPVTIARVSASDPVGGWALPEDRFVLLDGGHRVALMILSGREYLEPTDFVVVDGVQPPNNTALMLRSGRLGEDEAARFISRGLVGHEADPTSWDALVEMLDPSQAAAVASWRAADVGV